MLDVARYHADADGSVAPEAVDAWARDGLLVIENFVTADICQDLITAADSLVANADVCQAATVFSTTTHEHAASEILETSDGKIRSFFKEGVFDAQGNPTVSKAKTIKKTGHTLYDLAPTVQAFSYQPRLPSV